MIGYNDIHSNSDLVNDDNVGTVPTDTAREGIAVVIGRSVLKSTLVVRFLLRSMFVFRLIQGKGSHFRVIRHRFSSLVVTRPMILWDQGVIPLHFLLTIRQRDGAISVHFSSRRTLLNFTMNYFYRICHFFNAPGRNLLSVRITSYRGRIFFCYRFFLFNKYFNSGRIILNGVVLPFSCTPICRQSQGERESSFLLLRVFMNILCILKRLIRSSTNVSLNIRRHFFLNFICLLLNFWCLLTRLRGNQIIYAYRFRYFISQSFRVTQTT